MIFVFYFLTYFALYDRLCVHPHLYTTTTTKSLQSCPTLCDPIDGSPPGSPVPVVAISFSNAWKWKVKVKSLSRVPPFATPWTAAYQAPQSMGFSRQEYWSGVPLPSLPHLYKWPYFIPFSGCIYVPPPRWVGWGWVKGRSKREGI